MNASIKMTLSVSQFGTIKTSESCTQFLVRQKPKFSSTMHMVMADWWRKKTMPVYVVVECKLILPKIKTKNNRIINIP